MTRRTAMTSLVLMTALALALTTACSDGTPASAQPTDGVAFLPACSGDNDGVIAFGELHFTPGVVAPYAVQADGDPSVEPSGDAAAGRAVWDFTRARFKGLEDTATLSPRDFWYADRAPRANLAIPLSVPGAPPGHLLLRDDGPLLDILGVASVEPDLQFLLYSAGVPFMQFPMQRGDARSATVTLAPGSEWQGLALDTLGVEDTYDIAVAGSGTLKMPGLTIDNVLALTLQLTRRIPDRADTVSGQTYLVHECLGTVAVRAEPAGPWRVIWYPR